jgi:Mycothiol maleylpyruvate isomerase N-terminal domain
VTQPAHPAEWSVTQVASHLGSQAETFLLTLDAGLHGTAVPGLEQFQPIWDRWNVQPPADQVSDSLTSDQAFLEAVDALTDTQRRTWVLPMMGTEQKPVRSAADAAGRASPAHLGH